MQERFRLLPPLMIVLALAGLSSWGAFPAVGQSSPVLAPIGAYARPSATSTKFVSQVMLEGNDAVDDAFILQQIRTKNGRPLDQDAIHEDVRSLYRTGRFLDVETKVIDQPDPSQVIVVFHLVERPVVKEIVFVGNTQIKDRYLLKELGLAIGDGLDPYAVTDGRRKIEDYYREKGFTDVRVEIAEGQDVDDRRVVYVINEGHRRRIRWTSFVGNTVASDARLRTQIESKPPILWVYKGEVDEEEIERDVKRITNYYRGLGYFQAKVGRIIKPTKSGNWIDLTFVIDEGDRYKIRDIHFLGNEKFATDDFLADLKLKPGEFFDQKKLDLDRSNILNIYGGIGHIFADIQPETRFLDEPGELDLVYNVEEGDRFRVGTINIHIEGDNPHTRLNTVRNRLSVLPGDIVNVNEVAASERRLRAAQIFWDSTSGSPPPRIAYGTPHLDEDSATAANDSSTASRYRGQSPDSGMRGLGEQEAASAIVRRTR